MSRRTGYISIEEQKALYAAANPPRASAPRPGQAAPTLSKKQRRELAALRGASSRGPAGAAAGAAADAAAAAAAAAAAGDDAQPRKAAEQANWDARRASNQEAARIWEGLGAPLAAQLQQQLAQQLILSKIAAAAALHPCITAEHRQAVELDVSWQLAAQLAGAAVAAHSALTIQRCCLVTAQSLGACCEVPMPTEVHCSCCQTVWPLVPAAFGFFGSSPVQPTIIFDVQLLQLGRALTCNAGVAANAFASALGHIGAEVDPRCGALRWTPHPGVCARAATAC
jgi:hypothetical protein